MIIIITEVTEKTKSLVVELAKSLKIDFPKDRICKDCFHYDYGDETSSIYPKQHSCWNENKVSIRPSDPDDMSQIDYIEPYVILNINEAIDCTDYKSGMEEYKKLYESSKKELDRLKNDIRRLCK